MKKIISIILSIIFSLLLVTYILITSLPIETINPKILSIIKNYTIITQILLLILITIINIKNKPFISLEYIGNTLTLSSSFILTNLLFSEKLIKQLNNIISIQTENIKQIYNKSILTITIGIILIIIYLIIDTIHEKNKKINNTIEIIEEK